jgi:hypothetical protein
MSMYPSKQVVRACSLSQTINKMKVASLRARASGACARQSCSSLSLSNYAARKRHRTIMRDVDRAKASTIEDTQVLAEKRLARWLAQAMPKQARVLDSLGVARQGRAWAHACGDDGSHAVIVRGESHCEARRACRDADLRRRIAIEFFLGATYINLSCAQRIAAGLQRDHHRIG